MSPKTLFENEADLTFQGYHDNRTLANGIGKSFVQNVERIRNELDTTAAHSSPAAETPFPCSALHPWSKKISKALSGNQVRSLVAWIPCPLPGCGWVLNFHMEYGVPEGSRLVPLLYVIHASKLFKIIERHLPWCANHCWWYTVVKLLQCQLQCWAVRRLPGHAKLYRGHQGVDTPG